MEEILERMERDLDNTRTELMSCVNPFQLDSLAYKLVVKNDIFGMFENEVIDISNYVSILKNEEKPLERLYNIFEDMIIDNNMIKEETIIDCLNIIKEDFKNE